MSLEAAIAQATGRAVVALRRVGGGDINEAYAVELEGGGRAFVKTRPGAPAGEYAAEAAGLRWLGEPGGLGVPEVLGVSDELLALEWLDESSAGDEAELGRGLATVHAAGAGAFGAAPPADDPADNPSGAPRRRPTTWPRRRRPATRRAPPRRCGSARWRCPTTRSPTGLRSTPSGGCGRCWRRRATVVRCRRRACGGRGRV